MVARMTDRVMTSIITASREAGWSGSSSVETEHLLGRVLEADCNLAQLLFESATVVASIRAPSNTLEPSARNQPVGLRPLSRQVKDMLAYGAEAAERLGGWHIDTAHVLLGLLRQEHCRAFQILRDHGLEIRAAREKIERVYRLSPAQGFREILHQIEAEFPAAYWLFVAYTLFRLRTPTTPYRAGFYKLNEGARQSISRAQREARQAGSICVKTEHLLLGLLRQDHALAKRLLHDTAGIKELRSEIVSRKPVRTGRSTSVCPPLSREVSKALAFAGEEADRFKHRELGTLHLVAGLLRCEIGLAAEFLRARRVTLEKVQMDLGAE